MIVFVQPYGLAEMNGGARILRSLLQDSPLPFLSVCTKSLPPPPTTIARELHLPIRPYLGRIERTRFARFLGAIDLLFASKFQARLAAICQQNRATAIHGIAHYIDFWYAYQVAKKLNIPYFLTVHDDLAYALQGRPEFKHAISKIPEVWQRSKARFAISEAMGKEYCQRYGKRDYSIVTDGLTDIAVAPQKCLPKSYRIYFMGIFHLSYEPNFIALLRSLEILHQEQPDLQLSLTCRCGLIHAKNNLLTNSFPITVLPFASQEQVAEDMQAADILYLPLPFEEQHQPLSRYSLSTKMITYLGSGLPILYHGPQTSAAGQLLSQYRAAFIVDTLNPKDIARSISTSVAQRNEIAENALKLGREHFLLTEQRSRFWSAIDRC